METTQIRLASPADMTAIMGLLRRVVPTMRAAGNPQWDEGYPDAATFERDLEQGWLWVAAIDAAVAGVAAITTEQTPEYEQVGWNIEEPALIVHRLFVDPEFRGRGIAVALMRHAEELAIKQSLTRVLTDTSLQNVAAQRLFQKLGYRLAGETGLSYRPGLRVLCYEKRLA
jgi:ribosomal protein S18 acetylase RimI-like enzyme